MDKWNKLQKLLLSATIALCCTACTGGRIPSSDLTSISIVDHNGFSETISNQERLNQYDGVDFENSLPYSKVIRVYKRNENGDVKSVLTNYYPNGQIKQFLEALNGRAYGNYKEWHSNGQRKLDAYILGGTADLDTAGDGTWLFEGVAKAWNEDGQLLTEIPYSKGQLEGLALYYHPNGRIWKKAPYHKNELNGSVEIYLENGMLLQKVSFVNGLKSGEAVRFWTPERISSRETYKDGLLFSGEYYSSKGSIITKIENGEGVKATFGKDYIHELQQYSKGEPNGEVKVFNHKGKLQRLYHVKDGVKNGEETVYYETTSNLQPKLYVEWQNDQMNGVVKTWYPNGTLESQKEMHSNLKDGLSTAWYLDGNLMLIEEYQHNKLKKGQYFRKGEKVPTSKVVNGGGVATLFDAHGNFLEKFQYKNGDPIEQEFENNF